MKCGPAALAFVLALSSTSAFAGADSPGVQSPIAEEEKAWAFTISSAVYVVRDDREYVNPVMTADYSALHLEAR